MISLSYGDGIGTKYPAISADEAKTLIEKKTNLKVNQDPILAWDLRYDNYSPCPVWSVNTTDGETFSVFAIFAPTENVPGGELFIYAWNAVDDWRQGLIIHKFLSNDLVP